MPQASLPMYNLPEMQAENAAFWLAIRTEAERLGVMGLPPALDFARKPVPARIEPDTVFTQVCGWPLQTIYAGQAKVLGVPAYDAAHCAGPTHAGVFVVRRDAPFRSVADLRGCDFVFNSIHSNSGMNLPRRVIAELAGGRPFFGSIVETHSQPINLERVARGEADATCVDCVTYAFFARHRPGRGGAASYSGRDTAHARDPVRHRCRDRSGDKGCACTGAATRGDRAGMGARAGRECCCWTSCRLTRSTTRHHAAMQTRPPRWAIRACTDANVPSVLSRGHCDATPG